MELEPLEFIYGNSYVNWDRISKLGSHRRKRTVYKDATENNGSLSGHDLAGQNDTPKSVLTLAIANAEVTWSVSLIFVKLAVNISRWKACNRDGKVHRFERENWQYVNKFNGWLDGE